MAPVNPDRVAITIRIEPDDMEVIDRIVEKYKRAVPEARWTRHAVARLALREGLEVVEDRADKRLAQDV